MKEENRGQIKLTLGTKEGGGVGNYDGKAIKQRLRRVHWMKQQGGHCYSESRKERIKGESRFHCSQLSTHEVK